MKLTDSQLIDTYLDEDLLELFKNKFDQVEFNVLKIQLAELLKFLYISSIEGGGFIAVSPIIDELWHFLIIQTKKYEAICLSLPGKRFIHHKSIPLKKYIEKESSPDQFAEEAAKWIGHYNKYFDGFNQNNIAYWGIANFLINSLGFSLEQINGIKI